MRMKWPVTILNCLQGNAKHVKDLKGVFLLFRNSKSKTILLYSEWTSSSDSTNSWSFMLIAYSHIMYYLGKHLRVLAYMYTQKTLQCPCWRIQQG